MKERTLSKPVRKLRGQTLVEFTFVGIPLMFVLVSTFEISRGMWIFDTLAYAAKEGVRYAMVHGANCGKNSNACTVVLGPATNTCVSDNNLTSQGVQAINPSIAEVIRCAAKGLDPTKTQVTFTSLAGQVGPCTLETAGGNACAASVWPPTGASDPGDTITIKITTPFYSAIAMFFPGSKPVSFAAGILGAQSSDSIQY